MHETARCIGYPSDSTRAARERGRGAACGHRLRRPGPVRPAGPPSPPSHPLAPVAQACLSLLWLNSGRRRASPTSHWSWVSSRAACRRAGSPARITTVVLAGVQWGWLGLALPEADRRQHHVSRGPGDRWSQPSPVRG